MKSSILSPFSAKIHIFVLIISLPIVSIAEDKSGMIFVGIDTLSTLIYKGYFDFVLKRPCTSEEDFNNPDFQDHIRFAWGDTYVLSTTGSYGRFKDYGKLNLDSIKWAPPDSELVENNGGGLYRVFNVTPDSLMSIKSTSYIIKTRSDPRPLWEGPFFVKMKILDFIIIDSANLEIEMVFLWACQMNHSKKLDTMGIDTFDLQTPISLDFHKPKITNNKTQTVFKVPGNRFSVPANLVGKVRYAEVYDLRGSFLGRINIGKIQKIVDLKNHTIKNKVFVVRFSGIIY